ncbi:YeiH family putative sulfate export transporter [Erwinia rhapontici]|uniref:YeiH family putative sulfate export transporter n=1 Tax=Erwinia rhapontici TaxID=55212 RepID=UPI00105EEA31|nr:YeiH family putative sulfate export transporter [Erwinia rhapontici]MCS3607660.1 putative integral membrane protein (TIGR00698 family) [Erwinia rhapontici]NKG29697.1 YeiH family putative sulfate export transporter [Erwinia rhapontici]TDT01887.1 putative integral membrane protein (TIGR00698 family) [Erwinia rhapontici]
MADIALKNHHHSIQHFIPGLALAGGIAALAIWAGNIPWVAGLGLGALTLAIVFGIVAGNTLYPLIYPSCDSGILLAKQKLLRLGIILYGFRLTFQQIANVGISGVIIDIMTLSSTFFIACWLGRKVFGLDRDTAWLIGAGSSICGAAAVLATEPVLKAEASKVAVAVATVVIFGTIAIFLYPLLYPHVLQMFPSVTPESYGIYTGSTMHEVAQVVAAGHAIAPETENAAVISKMLRVMMLAPFLVILNWQMKRMQPATETQSKSALSFPWFALLFIVVALFNSLHLFPQSVVNAINQLDNVFLAMAMAALGVTTQVSQLKRAGMRPILLGLTLFIWLIVGGGAINLLVQHLMA